MKIMRKIAYTIAVAAIMVACGNAEDIQDQADALITEAQDATTPDPDPEPEYISRGKAITADGAITPAEMLTAVEGLDSLETKIAATINSCCAKKGCWMKVDLGNGEEMRVTFKDYGFFVPLNSGGSSVIMEGTVSSTTTSVADLRHYAEDGGATPEEMAAITEPETSLTFEATGVLVEMEEEPVDFGDAPEEPEVHEHVEGEDHDHDHDDHEDHDH